MGFRELSVFEWEMIKPLLPLKARIGDRIVLNSILYVLTIGCRWMDMPIRYGSYKTAWRRIKRWSDEGIWERIFKVLVSMRSYVRVAVDSSTVEARKEKTDRM